jgi:NTP pyrophosphatase (non-canonical NTP hydrolase)
MTADEYQRLTGGTESKLVPACHTYQVDLIHYALGLCTESGEFSTALKKHLFYGKELDETNLKEELGDLLWYIARACEALDTTLEEVMESNISKLRIRYPEEHKD